MLFSFKNAKKLLTADKKQRRIYRYKLLNDIAHRNGWRLHSPRYEPWNDPEYLRILEAGGYVFNDKKFMIYQLAKSTANMAGDTAECGVFKGNGSWLILHAEKNPDSTHHVFDSFEGVSEPLPTDNLNRPGAYEWKKHDMAHPLESVREKLSPFPKTQYYKGWIPERFAEVADRRFKFVHVDVDLYQPTLDSFKFFYDKMLPGGIMLCDDYACPGTPGAMQAIEEFLADKPENAVTTIAGSGFIVKHG